MEIIKELFVDWKLDTWANVLGILGFALTIGTIIIALYVKSEVAQIKQSYIFDKRINDHLKALNQYASDLNTFLNDYNLNKHLIRTEIGRCQSELEDLMWKLGNRKSWKTKTLIKFIKKRKNKPFINHVTTTTPILDYLTIPFTRFYRTTYDDTWIIYNNLREVITQVENFKKNKTKSL
jgi:hypothetical protein